MSEQVMPFSIERTDVTASHKRLVTSWEAKLGEDIMTCPKCGFTGGNDWSQCEGSCPMPMSPHFAKVVEKLFVTSPDKYWRSWAWRIYGYKILSDHNADEITSALAKIYDILNQSRDVSIDVSEKVSEDVE